jgi:hypothetical protein
VSRQLVYLSLLFAMPGDGAPTSQPPAWAAAPHAIESLSSAEEAAPAAAEIARRFNPAMALLDTDGPWPVSVRYAWSGGADLQARTVGRGGKVLRTATVTANADLDRARWDELPGRDAAGNRIEYWVDGPGDDRVRDGLTEWRRRWRAAPDKDRTPTQYAHLFWLDRAHGALVIQYWFYYPFNEWLNHHEGDWEHINVILAGPSWISRASDYRAVGYEYYFHAYRLDIERPENIGGHPVVFVGGRAQVLWWSGTQSGGSYPWPASYPGAGGGFGPFAAADDTRGPARFLDAGRFDVVLLPEPARLDARAHPELSWLRLLFFAGQPHMFANPPLVDWRGSGGPPRQPARKTDWNAIESRPPWIGSPVIDGRRAPLLAHAGN